MNLKNIQDVPAKSLKGKRVLLRLDLNVPMADGKITDDFRIKAALPTIFFLREVGAKIIIISHIEGKAGAGNSGQSGEKKGGDGKSGGEKGGPSLRPISDYLDGAGVPVIFSPVYFTTETDEIIAGLEEGDVLLFENLRINPGEKENDLAFAQQLAAMGDLYVNEAFPVSHRAHASIVGIPTFLPSYFGPVFIREVENLSLAFNPEKPFLFILGGAKFDTKMPLIEKFLKLADFIFVGGALANNFFKELGYEVGQSSVSDGNFKLPELLDTKKVFIPTDVVATDGGTGEEGGKGGGEKDETGSKKGGKNRRTIPANGASAQEKIFDLGPESLAKLADLVNQSQFVLWNGPLGNCEEGFSEGTEKLAEIISKAGAKSGAKSVVGGGDTVAAIQTLGLMDKFTFVSTGGGAMLDFLANETLPGIEAVKNAK